MFKNLSEKKRQLDNLISVSNGIKDLKSKYYLPTFVDSNGKQAGVSVIVDSNFHIVDLDFVEYEDIKFIIDAINFCLDDMKDKINKKTQEILNSKYY